MKAASSSRPSAARGSSALEIIIACAVLTLTMSAVLLIVFGDGAARGDARLAHEATRVARAGLEAERALAERDFDAALSTATTTEGVFRSSVSVRLVDDLQKSATSYVEWRSGTRVLGLLLSTLLSDRGAFACHASGDWSHPIAHAFSTTGLIPGHSSGFSIADLEASQRYLYVAAGSAPSNGDTFYIFSLPADPAQQPTYLGSVDNAPSVGSAGLAALAVRGDYAFVANGYAAHFGVCSTSSSCAQLQVIDMANPSAPRVVDNLRAPGVAGSGGQGVGSAITYHSGYLYLGLVKPSSGAEFHIYDVGGGGASLINPVWVGSFTVGRTINHIAVRGDYAYLATDDNARELIVLNISDKAHPKLAGAFDAPGSTGFGYGYAIRVDANIAYLGRSYVSTAPELYTLEVSNLSSLSVLGSVDIGTSSNPDSINALLFERPLAFLLTNKQLQVWDMGDPAHPAARSQSGTPSTFLPLPGAGTALTCDGSALYAAVRSATPASDSIMSITSAP